MDLKIGWAVNGDDDIAYLAASGAGGLVRRGDSFLQCHSELLCCTRGTGCKSLGDDAFI